MNVNFISYCPLAGITNVDLPVTFDTICGGFNMKMYGGDRDDTPQDNAQNIKADLAILDLFSSDILISRLLVGLSLPNNNMAASFDNTDPIYPFTVQFPSGYCSHTV